MAGDGVAEGVPGSVAVAVGVAVGEACADWESVTVAVPDTVVVGAGVGAPDAVAVADSVSVGEPVANAVRDAVAACAQRGQASASSEANAGVSRRALTRAPRGAALEGIRARGRRKSLCNLELNAVIRWRTRAAVGVCARDREGSGLTRSVARTTRCALAIALTAHYQITVACRLQL